MAELGYFTIVQEEHNSLGSGLALSQNQEFSGLTISEISRNNNVEFSGVSIIKNQDYDSTISGVYFFGVLENNLYRVIRVEIMDLHPSSDTGVIFQVQNFVMHHPDEVDFPLDMVGNYFATPDIIYGGKTPELITVSFCITTQVRGRSYTKCIDRGLPAVVTSGGLILSRGTNTGDIGNNNFPISFPYQF